MSPRTKHIILLVTTALLGTAVEVFGPTGPWAHAFWAPLVVALVTDLRTALGTVPALLLVAALGASSCATTGKPTPVATFGHCTTDALQKSGQSLLGRVTTALATGDYVGELAALAVQFGGDEVGCAVDLAIAELRQQVFASHDPGVSELLGRAQAWRAANP